MIGIEPGETTTLVFGDRLVTAIVRQTHVEYTKRTYDVSALGNPSMQTWTVDGRSTVTVQFDILSVTAVTKAQATAIGAAIEEAAPGTRQIDLEGL